MGNRTQQLLKDKTQTADRTFTQWKIIQLLRKREL